MGKDLPKDVFGPKLRSCHFSPIVYLVSNGMKRKDQLFNLRVTKGIIDWKEDFNSLAAEYALLLRQKKYTDSMIKVIDNPNLGKHNMIYGYFSKQFAIAYYTLPAYPLRTLKNDRMVTKDNVDMIKSWLEAFLVIPIPTTTTTTSTLPTTLPISTKRSKTTSMVKTTKVKNTIKPTTITTTLPPIVYTKYLKILRLDYLRLKRDNIPESLMLWPLWEDHIQVTRKDGIDFIPIEKFGMKPRWSHYHSWTWTIFNPTTGPKAESYLVQGNASFHCLVNRDNFADCTTIRYLAEFKYLDGLMIKDVKKGVLSSITYSTAKCESTKLEKVYAVFPENGLNWKLCIKKAKGTELIRQLKSKCYHLHRKTRWSLYCSENP